ncbi:MAG: rhodanese-like domain-containing protein [Candidatus Moranbacteria bacterium]|nr:rhodanese-like domain-containing protein [Candidatus Moranbacteria bacterium]
MPTPYQDNQRDKRTLLVGGLLIVAVGIYFVGKNIFSENTGSLPNSVSTDSSLKTNVPLIAPDILLKKIQNGDPVALIDVRPETAYRLGHIAHALSLPIGSLQNFSPAKDEMVVIIFSEDDAGVFETAKNIMNEKSFAYFFLKGGFEGWQTLNAPTVSTGDPNSFVDQSKVTYLSVEEYKNLLTQKTLSLFVLDIQTEEGFGKRHLEGAVNIPLDQLEKRVGEIPSGRQIVVYGENDLASFQGGVRLSDLGVFSARTLTGGKYLSTLSGLSFQP